MNYLIDDQPLDSITLAYDYAPNTDERHMNQVLDKHAWTVRAHRGGRSNHL